MFEYETNVDEPAERIRRQDAEKYNKSFVTDTGIVELDNAYLNEVNGVVLMKLDDEFYSHVIEKMKLLEQETLDPDLNIRQFASSQYRTCTDTFTGLHSRRLAKINELAALNAERENMGSYGKPVSGLDTSHILREEKTLYDSLLSVYREERLRFISLIKRL